MIALTVLPPWLRTLITLIAPRLQAPRIQSEPQPGDGDEVAEDERPAGCGWFDSSHDLRSGLQMQELARPEELAVALPLAFWLQLDQASRPA